MRPLVALLLLISFASAAPVPKALKKRDDNSALLGRWKVSEVTVNGNPSATSYHTFVFTDDGKLTLIEGKNTTGPQWPWTVDQTGSPRTMKWAGPNAWDCVYELDGDSLQLGLMDKGAKLPEKVEPSNGLTLYVMTRDTSK